MAALLKPAESSFYMKTVDASFGEDRKRLWCPRQPQLLTLLPTSSRRRRIGATLGVKNTGRGMDWGRWVRRDGRVRNMDVG